MPISVEDAVQLTNEIWDAMLGMPVRYAGIADPSTLRDGLGACVQITGAWEGAVRLDCSERLARCAAANFLGLTPEEVSEEQVRDAVGELTNMSAGSVKSLLNPGCHISLPTVVDGHRFTIRNSTVILQVGFESGQEPFSLSIFESERASATSQS
ncbi:MAG TPA: chemotaxis protein CheX [Clostridia bacterium]|nr:chemotaxis protein CheX [Clostridia bacterium]